MQNSLSALLWFAAVVAMIPVVLWLYKRTALAGATGAAGMRCLGVLPLAPGQRLAMVEVGEGEHRRWLVLGITAQGIATLHSMPPQEAAATPQAPLPTAVAGFAQLLQRARKEP